MNRLKPNRHTKTVFICSLVFGRHGVMCCRGYRRNRILSTTTTTTTEWIECVKCHRCKIYTDTQIRTHFPLAPSLVSLSPAPQLLFSTLFKCAVLRTRRKKYTGPTWPVSIVGFISSCSRFFFFFNLAPHWPNVSPPVSSSHNVLRCACCWMCRRRQCGRSVRLFIFFVFVRRGCVPCANIISFINSVGRTCCVPCACEHRNDENCKKLKGVRLLVGFLYSCIEQQRRRTLL